MSEAPARRIYLHVGQHKTGTTWIQNVLDHNRARLAEHGVCYPDLGACHGWPLVFLFAREDDIDRLGPMIGQRRRHSNPKRKAQNLAILNAALDDPKWRKIVISGEQLCDMLRWNEVRAMGEALQREGTEIKVIFYAREPLGYAASMTQQRLKAGLTLKELRDEPPTPDYRRRLQKYFRFFGRENVEIRVYDRKRLKDGDVLADFMDAIDEPGIALDAPASLAANSSMSGRAARLLDARNRLFQRISPTFARRHPPWIMPSVARIPGPRFALPKGLKAEISRSSAEDVAWLGRKLGFEPFPSTPPEGGAGKRRGKGGGEGGGKARGRKAGAGEGQGKGRRAGAGKPGAEQGAGKKGPGRQGPGERGPGQQGAGRQGVGRQGAGKAGGGRRAAGKVAT